VPITTPEAVNVSPFVDFAEIKNLHAGFTEDDVLRFEIAMDDSLRVRSCERVRYLRSIFNGLIRSERPAAQTIGERLALDEFHDEVIGPDVVESADIRMIERCDCPRFAFEAVCKSRLGNFDRDQPVHTRISGTINIAHAALAQQVFDSIGVRSSAR
jgi:hypothetical protein